jgi:hypothetical protein
MVFTCTLECWKDDCNNSLLTESAWGSTNCTSGIDFALFLRFLYWILKLFWHCGIFCSLFYLQISILRKPIANNIYLCSKIEIRYLSVIIHPSYVNHRAYCVIFSPPPCTIICVNKIAKRLQEINQNWSDETIFQETRKIIGAIIQHVTYNEYLPNILGYNLVRSSGLSVCKGRRFPNKYNPDIDPTIRNGFAAGVFRVGHTMIPPDQCYLKNELNFFCDHLYKAVTSIKWPWF